MTDLEGLWAAAFREFGRLARHEFRGALNGVEVNLEVVRSRVAAGKMDRGALAPFLEAAGDQLQQVSVRGEAMQFMLRVQMGDVPADVALTLKHMAVMLVPAARGSGVTLEVSGHDGSVLTSASPKAAALALVSGLLALIKEGGVGRCTLERGSETVVRFSHESAAAVSLDPEVSSALAQHGIQTRRSPQDLQILFP